MEALGARPILVGDNFRFGHKQAGDTRLLRNWARVSGFDVEVIPSVTLRGHRSVFERDPAAGRSGRCLARRTAARPSVTRSKAMLSADTASAQSRLCPL